MVDQTKQPQSIFPDIPRDQSVIDVKNGNLTKQWYLGLSSLFQALQANFKNEGILFPALTQNQLNSIKGLYTPYIGSPLPQDQLTKPFGQLNLPDISGQTVFDTTNRIPKQFIITFDASNPPNVLSADWMIINVMKLFSGDPNGNVAGVLNWFCYDTLNKVLYICTTSGSTITAVWSVV